MDKILLGIIGVAIIAIGILLSISDFQFESSITNNVNTVPEHQLLPKEKLENWHSSGPFHINKKTYDIGESIFMRVETLTPEEKGEIAILRQANETHYTVWKTTLFDGSVKQFFNQYWTPRIEKINSICSADDISGKWVMVFRGTNYPNLEFEFTDKILEGEERNYNRIVC